MDVPAPLGPTDDVWLERAATLARAGWGQVAPNPMVGCVIVRGGHLVGEGRHEVYGGPHAEVMALRAAGGAAGGATAYVSLEPCRHHGKTPPCVRALIDAGVRRVVFGAADPGEAAGGGALELQAAGVEVVGPVWDDFRARGENPLFHHALSAERPFLALKLAMTLDGAIASAPGVQTRITGDEADHEVHRLRSGFDAVMVGAGTVRADQPRLTVRHVGPGVRPTQRIVLLPDAALPDDSPLFEGVDEAPLHVFCSESASENRRQSVAERGGAVHPVPEAEGGLDLDAVLGVCAGLEIGSILCEGGATLATSLLNEERVDRCYFFMAPTLIGEAGVPAFGSEVKADAFARFAPFGPTQTFGRDALIVYDRMEGSA